MGTSRTVTVEQEGGRPLVCQAPGDLAIHVGDSCIFEMNGGPEFGRVAELGEVVEQAPGCRAMPRLVRQATLQDKAKEAENVVRSKIARETCKAKAEKLGFHLHLMRVHYSFDRSVLHVLFSGEQNIDSRPMASDLSAELRVRVDMQQVGVRDETSIVGGIGPCGRNLCCCSWLRRFEPINVRMAKVQRVSLNPAAMSGMCGRLKCCMRYEYEVYKDLSRGLPRNGAAVTCPEGKGVVLGTDVLKQKVKVQLEDDRILDFSAGDVQECWAKKGKGRKARDEDTDC